jgi:hypothetical protein
MRLKLILALLFAVSLSACGEQVGSDAWCEKLESKDKSDWTANEAADYAKNCVGRD